jgi:hypothetical protein
MIMAWLPQPIRRYTSYDGHGATMMRLRWPIGAGPISLATGQQPAGFRSEAGTAPVEHSARIFKHAQKCGQVRTRAKIRACAHAHAHIRTHVCTNACTARTHARTHACIHAYAPPYAHTRAHMYTCAHAHVRAHVRAHAHSRARTQIHTQLAHARARAHSHTSHIKSRARAHARTPGQQTMDASLTLRGSNTVACCIRHVAWSAACCTDSISSACRLLHVTCCMLSVAWCTWPARSEASSTSRGTDACDVMRKRRSVWFPDVQVCRGSCCVAAC